MPVIDVRCVRCLKTPDEIPEYVIMAEAEGYASPTQAVQMDEGTYNRENGHFACTECYIAMGQPSSPRGWKAP